MKHVSGKRLAKVAEENGWLFISQSGSHAKYRNPILTPELEALANRVYFDENIRTCPHGRPAILTFKKERFDKEFGRIQR